ncbi:MAG: Dna2/Cas4 domain-containing protein [Novosphingobium sp.]|uniref:Dna2/Cas4 domain-containing protein n=1 Tax=Novosphingobium sp. TaxID=1874826 RepID=UPI00262F5CF5|nr:Dna2/Cas4 domain-containing protein [Novosphingobium sp.]MCP5385457.1 Dna2/Cas4 domain-containing protein [Novosphingobium sp.]
MSTAPTHRLSKSKVAAFEHCPLRMWLQVHRPELAQHDGDTLARFQFGHDVGEKARFLQPDGVLIEAVPDIRAALAHTAELIATGPHHPLFEATFRHADVLVRVDVLEPDDQGGWRAVEVKASNRVKPTHLADLSTQIWVMRGAGVPISQAIIRHVSNRIDWRRPDATMVRFRDEDVTQRIERYVEGRPAIVAEAMATANLPALSRNMGPHCRRPFSCEFQAHCTARQEVPLIANASAGQLGNWTANPRAA